jgi:hypothetical protein
MADANQLAAALRKAIETTYSDTLSAEWTALLAAFEAQAAMSPKQTSGTSEPVAWSVTFNGEHIGNLYQDLADAQEHKANLDASWPNEVRTVAPLFAAPVAQASPTYAELWQAVQDIDTWACTLPTFAVAEEGGFPAVVANIIRAIKLVAPVAQAASDDDMQALLEARAMLSEIGLICREQTRFVGSYADIVRQAFDALEQAAPWVSVTERLPAKNTEVLVKFRGIAIPSTGQYTGCPYDKRGWCYPSENNGCGEGFTDPVVTHWMPLPQPPKENP